MDTSFFLLFAVLGTCAVSAIIFLGASIYWACIAKTRGFSVHGNSEPLRDIRIISIDNNYITFIPSSASETNSKLPTISLVGNYGHVVTNHFIKQKDEEITRGIKCQIGELKPGEKVGIDLFVYQGDPYESFSLKYKQITYESELGKIKAWHIPARSKNWVICVHGHRSDLRESFRLTPTFVSLNLNVLFINYRNDEEQPVDPQKIHTFGIREWLDLEGAVKHIQSLDTEEISILGHSMGGGIVIKYLLESENCSKIKNIILESPTLDLNQIIANQAKNLKFMPGFLLISSKFFLAFMLKIRWDDFRFLERSSELAHPILLIHSEEDNTVPITASDQLFKLRPDIVTYIRLKKGSHAAAWNQNQEALEKKIRTFMNGAPSDN
tara:strand:+ start:721 stop:1866 length:1146 start_codon:yes stop_codon:yes gene_type:complete